MTELQAGSGSPARRSRVVEAALRGATWLILGGWIGAWLLFGTVVAPTAFAVLPTTEVAGQLVGPVLTSLHLFGAVAGLALAILARALGRRTILCVLPLVMSAACLYSHFGVSAAMSEIRDLAFGPGGSAEIAGRFNRLHMVSLTIFVLVGVAGVGLLGLHAWADSRGSGAPGVSGLGPGRAGSA